MYDFSKVSIIYPFRKDIEDRVVNLELSIGFFRKYCENVEIVVVEQDNESQLAQYPNVLSQIDRYEFLFAPQIDNNTYAKSMSLNHGALNCTKRPIIITMDTDTLVDPLYIDMAAQGLKNQKRGEKPVGVVICYNGCCILTSKLLKKEFAKDISYETLLKHTPKEFKINYKDYYTHIVNFGSMGGVCMFLRDVYLYFGGFNPLFKGWGYEDIEIIRRIERMNLNVCRISHPNAWLWHLDHKGTQKATNPNYPANTQIYELIMRMKQPKEILDYIKQWTYIWQKMN